MTNVIIQQPQYQPTTPQTQIIIQQQPQAPAQALRSWESDICSFTDDCVSSIFVLFCSECYICYLYHQYDEFLCTPLFVPMSLLLLRTKHRSKHDITGSIGGDCCLTYWCYWCSMCQLKRDMDYVYETNGTLD